MKNIIKANFKNNGFYLLKNLYPKKKLFFIKNQIIQSLKNYDNFLPIKNISAYNKKSKLLLASNGSLKKNLKKKEIKKGLNYISKKTNSISIRDPLITILELNQIVFNNKIINYAKKILGTTNIKLGYIKLGIFFNNKLPKNCINYFHTDDLDKKVSKLKVCKFSFSFMVKKKEQSEFGIIPVRKDKLDLYKQYFEEKSLGIQIKQKIKYPKLSFGDVIVFDPNNFYHLADKPKKNLRIIFYIEFLSAKNVKIFKKMKILRSIYQKLDISKKKLCSSYEIIN